MRELRCSVRHCGVLIDGRYNIDDFPACELHGLRLRDQTLRVLQTLQRPAAYLSSWHDGPVVLACGEPLRVEHLVLPAGQ